MNCPRCNTELPNEAAFCPQCGNPTGNKSVFPPDPQFRKAGAGSNLLIGCACGCGALLMILMLVAIVALFVTGDINEHLKGLGAANENLIVGTDFNLYGKTLDDEDFDWESLRGKYVLVKFTATWCGPCKMEVPGMLEAYKKYHDKGLEIVSVYIWEDGNDTIKKFVQREKIPWTIISEPLSEKAEHPPFGETFGIQGVPTMLLVDKEGKILATDARGATLQRELKKLFDE
jgi:thiol-disulfide isomerase/thioredoxin